jgi:organic hydroperoxide reductase OsmC/OhrA
MSTFRAQVTWARGDERFIDNRYSRGHLWSFDGGATVAASSSPEVVPLPYSVPENVDPEEAFVAALSSCHMLFFLSLAARAGFVVDSYVDHAEGVMSSVDGATQVTEVSLNPRVSYAAACPERTMESDLHHRAHALCFLANSVKSKILIKPFD